MELGHSACPLGHGGPRSLSHHMAERTATLPSTPSPVQDIMIVRRDVRCCGAALALRTTACRAPAQPARIASRPLRRLQRADAMPLMPARLHDLVLARHDVQRCCAALVQRSGPMRPRPARPHSSGPLHCAQRAAAPPNTPAPVHDLATALQDVLRCGAALALRAAARRTHALHA
jgi:hypothetical protein